MVDAVAAILVRRLLVAYHVVHRQQADTTKDSLASQVLGMGDPAYMLVCGPGILFTPPGRDSPFYAPCLSPNSSTGFERRRKW